MATLFGDWANTESNSWLYSYPLRGRYDLVIQRGYDLVFDLKEHALHDTYLTRVQLSRLRSHSLCLRGVHSGGLRCISPLKYITVPESQTAMPERCRKSVNIVLNRYATLGTSMYFTFTLLSF